MVWLDMGWGYDFANSEDSFIFFSMASVAEASDIQRTEQWHLVRRIVECILWTGMVMALALGRASYGWG